MNWSDGQPQGRKASFPPHVTPATRLLVLGSLPGEASLATRQYYAHPRNRFWHLMGHVLGEDLPAMRYGDRLAALERRHIGLWDAVASAVRPGSLDTAIREHVANPLADLATRLPHLQAVACNGQKAAQIAARELVGSGVPLITLPSSSPAHAAMPLAEKQRRWEELRRFV